MSGDTETKRISLLRMAKASAAEIAAAVLLNSMLSDVFEDGAFPRGLGGEFSEGDPEYFDEDDPKHLRVLYDRLREVYRRHAGGMNRVVWGFDVLMNPANRLVDPEADYLAAHPLIRWAEEGEDTLKGGHRTGEEEKGPRMARMGAEGGERKGED